MPSDITGYDDCISGLCQFSADGHSFFDLPHSGRGDKNSIHLSFSGNLCISRYNMYPGLFCCFFHGSCDFFEFVHWKSLFNYKSAGKIKRFCTHTGKIIYRSADRQFADISPRKKCRRYNKPICRYCHSSCRRN